MTVKHESILMKLETKDAIERECDIIFSDPFMIIGLHKSIQSIRVYFAIRPNEFTHQDSLTPDYALTIADAIREASSKADYKA